MAYDKLVDSSQLNSDLEDIADAIRAKSGGSSQLAFPSGFISEIGSISTGGGGGSGETLRASGTYTFTGGASMTIPVSFTGTATRVFVIGQEIPSGVARTFIWLNGNLTFQNSVSDWYYTTITRKVAANGNQSNDANTSLTLANNEITCTASTGAYQPAPVTYNWYIWGVA